MSSKFSNFNFVSLEESSDNFESYHRWTCWKLQPTFLKLSDEQRRVTTPSCVNCQEKKQGFCKFFYIDFICRKNNLLHDGSHMFSANGRLLFSAPLAIWPSTSTVHVIHRLNRTGRVALPDEFICVAAMAQTRKGIYENWQIYGTQSKKRQNIPGHINIRLSLLNKYAWISCFAVRRLQITRGPRSFNPGPFDSHGR